MSTRLLVTHALSPLHTGTGQGVGVIDLPVAREKATGLPYLPGSSVKGVLRDACQDGEIRKKVFGPDTDAAHEHAASVQISDQRLLLFPVRSLAGTFAWVTSPYVLRRFLRDAQMTGIGGHCPAVPAPAGEASCFVAEGSALLMNDRVVMEDLDLTAGRSDDVRAWAEYVGALLFPDDPAWQGMLTARLCVLHDDVLSFLVDTATEVTARVRLREDTKTVEEKVGPWYEEALPTDTVLAGLVAATPVKADPSLVFATLAGLIEKPLQLGGRATVGRGLCRLRLAGGDRP